MPEKLKGGNRTMTSLAILGAILLRFAVPVAFIVFGIWHVRKLNNIERTVRKILEKSKTD